MAADANAVAAAPATGAPTDATGTGAPAGSRLPLAWRLFLPAALVVVLAAGSAALSAWRMEQQMAREAVSAALDGSTAARQALVAQRLGLLERGTALLAADPVLAASIAGVEPATTPDSDPESANPTPTPVLESDSDPGVVGAPGRAALHALLRERRQGFGFDLGLVLDAGGAVLARSDREDTFGERLADDPLVAAALAAEAPPAGFWRHQDRLYQAAILPVQAEGAVRAHLLLAQPVDDAFSRDIARASGAELAWWLPDSPAPLLVASSLPEARAEALAGQLAATPELVDAVQLGQHLDAVALELDGEAWQLRATPTATGAPALGLSTALASATHAASGYRQVLERALLAGLAALLLAGLLSLWLARRLSRPVQQLADATGRASAGDYGAPTRIAGHDALAQLGERLDTLLSDLDEKRAVEDYLARNTRLLADGSAPLPAPPLPVADVAAPEPPRQGEGVLLALEYPFNAAAGADATADSAQALATWLQALAARCGGRLALGDGERWLLAFDGPERTLHALQAASIALHAPDSDAARPGAALADGTLLETGLTLGRRSQPALIGTPCRQVLRLLCESAPGTVLVARPLGERIREQFGTAVLGVATGTLARKRYYALALDQLGTLPAPAPADVVQDAMEAQPSVPVASAASTADAGALQAGDRIDGRYEILSLLRADATVRVYKARDLEAQAPDRDPSDRNPREQDELVALACLRPGTGSDEGWRQRLEDGVRRARRIRHPHVLRSFELLESDGMPCIAGEYLHGPSLRALLEQSGTVPLAAGLRIARQLCSALKAVHAVGLLHLDIRPERLLFAAGGELRLAGTGIAGPPPRGRPGAQQPDLLHPQGTGVDADPGRHHYAAPELLAGDAGDPRSDIHAVGVVLSEMFCGGLPYEGANSTEIYLAQVQQEPRRPSSLWPEIPQPLERLILRCIARRREDRFQDAGELAAALAGVRAPRLEPEA